MLTLDEQRSGTGLLLVIGMGVVDGLEGHKGRFLTSVDSKILHNSVSISEPGNLSVH